MRRKITFELPRFVVDIENYRFIDPLSISDMVRVKATAQGPIVVNCHCLF